MCSCTLSLLRRTEAQASFLLLLGPLVQLNISYNSCTPSFADLKHFKTSPSWRGLCEWPSSSIFALRKQRLSAQAALIIRFCFQGHKLFARLHNFSNAQKAWQASCSAYWHQSFKDFSFIGHLKQPVSRSNLYRKHQICSRDSYRTFLVIHR